MIVRREQDRFTLIAQHDHGLVSGEFAAHMKHPIEPLASTLYAIAQHDSGWQKLDRTVLWNKKKNEPYSFQNYPMKEKLVAYTEGISAIAEHNPYAGFLCSMHFASFFINVVTLAGRRFRRQEKVRQEKLQAHFTELELANIDDNFRLLQFCDDLSLAICLNQPMQNSHPWYANGIKWNGQVYQWQWESEERLQLVPNLFRESFTIELPYQVVDQNRQVVEQGVSRYEIVCPE